ncbi:MAG: glycosyltransferase family 9 protein [Methylophilaceae bacterium]|nr:MAG: glycosyltransferase family 9 protein [Methylophilaceae bacterium]
MIEVKNIQQLLIIKHGALGDLMQSIGLIIDIKQHYPNHEITLLTAPAYCSLMQRCPAIDQLIADNRAPIWRVDQQIKLKKKLHKKQFDLVIDLQNSERSRMYQQFWFAQTKWIGRRAEADEPSSGLIGLIDLLNDVGIATPHAHQSVLTWLADDMSVLLNERDIVAGEYIVLIPGSSAQHLEKRWPYYEELATALINKNYQVVVVLGPDESTLAKQMPGHVLQGLNWFQLAGVLNTALYVIGNDTGPSHIASYLNKAGLAIFGPSTSATRAEIGRRKFEVIEVDDLANLTVAEVLQRFKASNIK